jgi:hypothetical protein
MLMKDRKILETVNAMRESSLLVESRSLSQLLSLVSSPACVKKVAKDLGTATLVNYRGVIIALTCSHVIVGRIYGAVVFVCGKDGDTNKFKLESAPHRFGYGFNHPDCDFAGVLPLPNHAFMVNLLEEIEATVKLAKWWKDEEALADKVKFLMMTDVMKCGISSRKTIGRVIDDHFYVAGK